MGFYDVICFPGKNGLEAYRCLSLPENKMIVFFFKEEKEIRKPFEVKAVECSSLEDRDERASKEIQSFLSGEYE